MHSGDLFGQPVYSGTEVSCCRILSERNGRLLLSRFNQKAQLLLVQGHQIELRRDAYLVGSNHHAGTIFGKTASSELIQSFDTCSLEMTPTSIPEGTNGIVSVNHNIVYGCLNSRLIGHNLEEGKTWWIDKVSGVLNIDFFNEHTLLGVPNANHCDIDWYASYLQVDIETGSVRRLRTFQSNVLLVTPTLLDENRFVCSTHSWETGVQKLLLLDRRSKSPCAILQDSSLHPFAQIRTLTKLDANSVALTGTTQVTGKQFLYSVDLRYGVNLEHRSSPMDYPRLFSLGNRRLAVLSDRYYLMPKKGYQARVYLVTL